MKRKIINTIYKIYELSILPPQNVSLLELKRKEFKEKTKYLDMKLLYNLTEDEKNDLRLKGYYVDLTEETIKNIHNFNLSYNRHEERYLILSRYYNFDKFADAYYVDQYIENYHGDPEFNGKLYRTRVRVKKRIMYFSLLFFLIFVNYLISERYIYKQRMRSIKYYSNENSDNHDDEFEI